MTQQELEVIINSDLPINKKSELIKQLYDTEHADVHLFKEGGEVTEEKVESAAEKVARLMEEVIKPAAEAGNKTALRFLDVDKNFYTFTEEDKAKGSKEEAGSKGNVYVKSADDYMVPLIQYRDGNLTFIGDDFTLDDDDTREQSIKFASPEDAEFFASNYHDYPEMVPMLQNKQYSKDMTLEEILNSNISDSAKAEIQQAFGIPKDQQGAQITITIETETPKEEVREEFNASPMTISIGGKSYDVRIADTEESRRIGLSKETELPEDEGMLFVFEEPSTSPFTMAETSIDLDIIFIDEEGEVIEVQSVKAHDEKPVECKEEYCYVLEVNYGSGIEEGDQLESESDEFSDEEKDFTKQNKMLMLDENGDVQMKLVGGERIVSRIKTRQLIKAAIKAYRNDTERDYRRVGKMIMQEFFNQDHRDPQYVQAPEKKGEKDGE